MSGVKYFIETVRGDPIDVSLDLLVGFVVTIVLPVFMLYGCMTLV